MGHNEQNHHFAELRQKVCLYIHVLVLQRGLPNLECKLERFVPKKWEKRLPNSSQTDYRYAIQEFQKISRLQLNVEKTKVEIRQSTINLFWLDYLRSV